MKSAFLFIKGLLYLYDKQTRVELDKSLVSYRSTRAHVLFSISWSKLKIYTPKKNIFNVKFLRLLSSYMEPFFFFTQFNKVL